MNNFIKPTIVLLLTSMVLLGVYQNSIHYDYFYDATQNSRNSLTHTSQSLLHTFKLPIQITLYTQDADLRLQSEDIIQLYTRESNLVSYQHINTPLTPELKEKYKFSNDGLVITTGNSSKSIDLTATVLNEAVLSQALFTLARKKERWVVFTEGHGEPNPFGKLMTDLSLFHLALKNQGIHVQTLNLAKLGTIPNNTSLLIIGPAKNQWLPGEITLLKNYLDQGGNLLVLQDPQNKPISELFDWLGLEALPGVVVDANGQQMGTPHPAISIITEYQNFIGTKQVTELSAFPWAQALKIKPAANNDWQAEPFLKTHAKSWTETKLDKAIEFNPELGEVRGPLTIGVYFTRITSHNHGHKQQRVIVIGNSRFLSNNAIQNYGNLSLGLSMLNWLNEDDSLLEVSHPTPQDQLFQLPKWLEKVYLFGFITTFPLLILLLVFLNMKKWRANSLKALTPKASV